MIAPARPIPVLAQQPPTARFVVTVTQAFPLVKILADLREHLDQWTEADYDAFTELVEAVNAQLEKAEAA